MKRIISTMLVMAAMFLAANAQRTFIMMQGGSRLSDQSCFFENPGNNFPSAKLNQYWNSGRRITSMTYGDHGWFFVFSANSGIQGQRTFDSFDAFPEDLFEQMQREGFCLTEMSKGPTPAGNKWCLVYSSYEQRYRQAYICDSDWNRIGAWINDQWQDGFYVTKVYYDGAQWYLVSTENPDFKEQLYMWANSYETLSTNFKTTTDKGYYLDNVNYGPGGYLQFFSRRSSRVGVPNQIYCSEPSDPIGWIKTYWSKGYAVFQLNSFIPAVENKLNAEVRSSNSVQRLTVDQRQHHNLLSTVSPQMDNVENHTHRDIENTFGLISDYDGRFFEGVCTMTGIGYVNGREHDMGCSPLLRIEVYFDRLVANGAEFPFIGWTAGELRCYGKPDAMFTVSRDLNFDYRSQCDGSIAVFGIVKGNLMSIFNNKRTNTIQEKGVVGEYIQGSHDSEVLRHNNELLATQWRSVEKKAAHKIAMDEDTSFSFCLRSFAERMNKALAR